MVEDEGGGGTVVKLVLEKGMRLGAKIKSFQDLDELRGKIPHHVAEDGHVQPLCILVNFVAAGGAAEKFGLRKGDRLLLVDEVPVESFDDYAKVLDLLRDKRPIALTFAAHGPVLVGKGVSAAAVAGPPPRLLRTKSPKSSSSLKNTRLPCCPTKKKLFAEWPFLGCQNATALSFGECS